MLSEDLHKTAFMLNHTFDTKQLFADLAETAEEFLKLISSADEMTMNTIPFEGSWTVSQLASHVTKSNKAIEQSLHMEGSVAERDPAERVTELKEMFLDLSVKFRSPDFIMPGQRNYQRTITATAYDESMKQLIKTGKMMNLNQIISLPAFGEITKLELLHFVLYHTKRHIYQLKNILQKVKEKQNNNDVKHENIG